MRRVIMKKFALCGAGADVDRSMSRRETCRSCGGDMHICLNCRFYSESAHNNCIEIRAEHQRHKDKANFCDYLQYKESSEGAGSSEKDEARKSLDDLFK